MATASTAAGELRYDDSDRVWLSWTGRRWARASYAADPGALTSPSPFTETNEVSDARRKALLGKAVDAELMRGATLMSRADYSAILSYRKQVSHLMHAVLSVLTLGLWTTVWLIVAITHGEDRIRFNVDRWGNVWPTEV